MDPARPRSDSSISELRQLPSPRAPRTLLPRVMRAVRARRAHRAGAGWRTWPRAPGGSRWSPAAAGRDSASYDLADAAEPRRRCARELDSPTGASVAAALQELSDVVSAVRVVWRVLMQPVVVFRLVVLAIMSAACAAFGTAIGRVALGGASRL